MEIEKKTLGMRYATANQAMNALRDSIALMKEYEQAKQKAFNERIEREYCAHRDSVIKRFEFTLDVFWKFTKFYLEDKFGVVQNSPKPVMKECYKNHLINEQQTLLALEMIDSRNASSHMYSEGEAEDILKKIPHYAELMQVMLQKMIP